ncbi:TRAP transporter small permease [Pseudoruegeria sp. SK021]|uniref:TRAP transporter small permease n=1 Tax=Pseudoruegeria sp. SK021 TaxID=1933035 RepID=UPI000A24585A|nr:TRAP transporter small permease [Pseudoruegeria sp. SK021]OSP56008.1 TRAP transporter [Pseudoruegeria sp. SK021]
MRVLIEGYYRLLKLLLTLLITALIVPVSMQILSRYTGVIPRYIWTEEIARFCFVWIIMIGAMIAVRDGTHFDVDLLPHSPNPLVELIGKLIVHAAILLMAVSFLIWGYDFGILGSRQRSEISGLPMLSIYIAWPIAGATWVLFTAERAYNDINDYRKGAPHGAR